jgi:hypothetical protein
VVPAERRALRPRGRQGPRRGRGRRLGHRPLLQAKVRSSGQAETGFPSQTDEHGTRAHELPRIVTRSHLNVNQRVINV